MPDEWPGTLGMPPLSRFPSARYIPAMQAEDHRFPAPRHQDPDAGVYGKDE